MINFEEKWLEQKARACTSVGLCVFSSNSIRGCPQVLEGTAIMKEPGATMKAAVGVLASTPSKEIFMADTGQKGQEGGRGHGGQV